MICMFMHLFGHHDAVAPAPDGKRALQRPCASSREILDRRYANGEMTREHYRELRQILDTSKGSQ